MAERQALGIDINKYARTGGINYDLVNEGIQAGVYDFLIISTGVGFSKSEIFDEQRENVERLGIPYVTYHLIDPRNSDIRGQAREYFAWVGAGQTNYIVDIESPDRVFRPPNKAEVLSYINELESLIGKQPILYSNMQVLKQIGFVDVARKFRLWMAHYLWDPSKSTDEDKVQYGSFDDFVRDHAMSSPPSVLNTPLQDNVILWQFSAKGDGRRYIYNATTAHPKFTVGMFDADLNISIQERSEFMQQMFERVPEIKKVSDTRTKRVDTHERQPVSPSGPTGATYPSMTNQDMINLIFKTAEPFTADPWEDWVVRARLESLANPKENRSKPYTGPRVEDLPNLSDTEKSAILLLLDESQEQPLSAGPKAVFTPSVKAVARFVGELNNAGKPIWSIFPSDNSLVKDRIIFKTPVEVDPDPVIGDGGAQCYKLIKSPISTPLYVRPQDGTITKS
ncbi:MAG: GH25 family lysozyme [Anaerolineales bacterium]|jgi:hypothetical protein